MVLKFCDPGQIDGQDYELAFEDDTLHVIGTITTDMGDCACRVYVVGDTDSACPDVIAALQAQYGVDCVTLVPTTVMNDVELDACEDPADPGLVRFIITPDPRIVELPEITYDLYRVCPGDECCKFASGTVPSVLDEEGPIGVVEWHNPCCDGGGAGQDYELCPSCCICNQAPGTFYYPLWKIVVTGVIDNPFYTIDGGGPSCNCDQFNGTFYLRHVAGGSYACQYVSTSEIEDPHDYLTAGPTDTCINRSMLTLTGTGAADFYPQWHLDCQVLTANMAGSSDSGGSLGPTFVRYGEAALVPLTYLHECSAHTLDHRQAEFPYPTVPPAAGPPSYFYGTPCTTLNSTVTIEPVGAPLVCTPEMMAAASDGVARAAMELAGKVGGKKKELPRGRCIHLGKPTGELVPCQSCNGKVSLKVLACEKHGSCTVARMVPGQACCATCDQWETGIG